MISVVIIVYNKTFNNCETLQSLIKLSAAHRKLLDLTIWNNGTHPFSQHEIQNVQTMFEHSLNYVQTPENLSLAVIYNKVIDRSRDSLAILLCDQDTYFEDTYFDQGISALHKYPDIDLFLPVVRINELIVSPGDFGIVKGKYWKTLQMGVISSKKKAALASGMLIRTSLFKTSSIRFNESLKLYNIDTDFVVHYSKVNPFLFVLNYELKHGLSFFEKEPIQKKLIRFKDHRRSIWFLTLNSNLFHRLIGVLYMIYMSFRNALRYRDFRFLSWRNN